MTHTWKRRLILLCCTFGCLMELAAGNYQKIYPIDSDLVRMIRMLYVREGLALPSSSGPWSGGELSLMLDRLDYGALSFLEKQWYDEVRKTLDVDGIKEERLSVGIDATLQSYFHPNPKNRFFQGTEQWFRERKGEEPLLVIPLDGTISQHFYGYIEGDVAKAEQWDEDKNQPKITMGDKWFGTNLPTNGLDLFVPYRALLAAGGAHWSLEVGRERLSWGNGTTGNLLLGDQVRYHNMVRMAAYGNSLKYTFLVSAFPHPQNYYSTNNGYFAEGVEGRSDYEDGVKAYIAHRLEARLFHGRLGVAVTDSVMYMSDTNKIDLIDFNPAMFYHNNFKRALTNTIIGLEFDVAIMKGLNLYTQIVIDDWASSGETKPSDATASDPAEPNAVGLIAGSTYIRPLGKGFLSFNLEGAYTSPYLYLRDSDMQGKKPGEKAREQKRGQYGINFVVGTHSSYYREQFMGYQYGCDAMVANLRVSYEELGRFSLSGNLFYMAHGTHDQFTVWSQIDGVEVHDGWLPSSSHETENQYDAQASSRDAVAHTMVLGVNGACQLPYGCSVFGQMDYVWIKNPGGISKHGIIQDLQLTIGLEWKMDDLARLIKRERNH